MFRCLTALPQILRAPEGPGGSSATSQTTTVGEGAVAPGDPPAGDPPAGDPPAGDPPAGDPPAGDPPAGDPPAGDPPAGDPPAGPYKPEGVAPELLGETDRETIDKLSAALTQNAPPATAEEYEFAPEPAVAAYFDQDLAADPALKVLRESLFEAGVPKAKFGEVVAKLIGGFEALGMAQPAVRINDVIAALGDQGKARYDTADKFISAMEGQKKWTPEKAAVARQLLFDTDGVELLEGMRTAAIAAGLDLGGEGAAPSGSKDDALAMLKDDRYGKDKEFTALADAAMRKAYPDS